MKTRKQNLNAYQLANGNLQFERKNPRGIGTETSEYTKDGWFVQGDFRVDPTYVRAIAINAK